MILPQIEQGTHGVEVVGMMFFDDNVYALSADNDVGKRLSKIAEEQNILLINANARVISGDSTIIDLSGSQDLSPASNAQELRPELYS